MDPDGPQMQFESDEWQAPTSRFEEHKPKVVEWVIKYSGGYVKDEKQATRALIGFVILAGILTFFILFSGNSGGKIEAPPGQRVVYPSDAPPHLQQVAD